MTRYFRTYKGREFRVMCPECVAIWESMTMPAYCPGCGALVTFRTVKWTKRELRRADGEAKKLAQWFRNNNGTS